MKSRSTIAIVILAVSGSLFARSPLYTFNADSRIERAFSNSSIIRTFLKNDAMTIESREGCVTLIGTVSHDFHISLAQDTAENLPGVKSVDNRLTISEVRTGRSLRKSVTPLPPNTQ